MAARLESDVLLAACLDLAGSVGRRSDLVSKGELSGGMGTRPKREFWWAPKSCAVFLLNTKPNSQSGSRFFSRGGVH